MSANRPRYRSFRINKRKSQKRDRGRYIFHALRKSKTFVEPILRLNNPALSHTPQHVHVCELGYFNDRRKRCVHRVGFSKHLFYFRIELQQSLAFAYFRQVLPANTFSSRGFQGKFSIEWISSFSLAHGFSFRPDLFYVH